MPEYCHHVSCVTYEGEAVESFLGDVLGMSTMDDMFVPEDVTGDFLTWPRPNPGANAKMLGSGMKGLVEVVRAPEEMRGQVRPGTAFITFAVTDLDERVAKARELGFEATDIKTFAVNDKVTTSVSLITAGDLTFELVRFDAV